MKVEQLNLGEIYTKFGLSEFYFYHFNDLGAHTFPNYIEPQRGKLVENVDLPHPDLPYYLVDDNGKKHVTNPYIYLGVGDDLATVINEFNVDIKEWQENVLKTANQIDTIVERMKKMQRIKK